jgi:hypothetical protein
MSGSKSSRHIASIITRGNTCGGIKKTGLSYTGVGPTKGAGNGNVYNNAVNTIHGIKCLVDTTRNPTQIRRGSYLASHNPMM